MVKVPMYKHFNKIDTFCEFRLQGLVLYKESRRYRIIKIRTIN